MDLTHLQSIIHQTPIYSRHRQPPHRTALFISAYDSFAWKQYFLSAAHDGGSVTHLATLDDVPIPQGNITQSEHSNGLVCFNSENSAFVVNPSTHKIFKLPDSPSYSASYGDVHECYLFGFDESRNEHKVLKHCFSVDAFSVEIFISSMSNYSWRKVNEELPVDLDTVRDCYFIKHSVCVDSVIHFMLNNAFSFDIFAFDLRMEKFSKISTPEDIVPHEYITPYDNRNGNRAFKCNDPLVIKINGCVGVVCHDRVVESNEMHIWILQDYETRVWVKETITFPQGGCLGR